MLVYAFFLLILVERSSCSCPSGFELVKDGECRGLKSSYNVYFDDAINQAIATCKAIDGQPIIIHNEEHQTYWRGKVKATWTTIGLVCNKTTNLWEWSDGTAVDFKPPVGSYTSDLDSNCKTGLSWILRSDGYWSFYSSHDVWTSADFFCTTQIISPERSLDGCDNFGDDSEDGVCYQIGATAENWQDAQMMCRSFGADIASIHNSKENSFVRRLAVSKGKVDSVYLGATPSGKGDGFGWIDGSEWDYDNFYAGFPMKGLGDCVTMDTDGTSGLWANVDCTSKRSVACIRQQNNSNALVCKDGPWKEGDLIYSPGYPFDASIPCDYILSVDSGKKVQVEILLLEANSCCDHLLIFEDYMGGTIIANLTGEISDKTYKTSSSNFMRVSWQPQGGVNVRGMLMTFKAV